MRSARPAVLALVAFSLLFWSFYTPVVGQNSAGRLAVSTDYELFGTSSLTGGGHVTWTLTGSKSADLRAKILHLFDEYGRIPRGFPFAGTLTPANGDGTLEPSEGVTYTDLLENVLEGVANRTIGTPVQYMLLYPFDLREKNGANPGVGFERSTSGLANTALNTTADVEIRFLFEANSATGDARVALPTKAFANALYEVFWYEAAQSPTLAPSGPYPGSWPFLLEGGWHNVTVNGRAAMWAGNLSTRLYDNGTVALSRTSADPALAASSAFYEPFDLRFASRAWATFNYTGQVADPGDRLRLEIARAPAFTVWTPLPFGSGLDVPPTLPGVWSNATVDLSSFLGQRVRLRLNFTADATGNARGFFVRDFVLHAPSYYEGEIVESDTHYLVGALSFSDPAVATGGIQVIRTPGGEILLYGSTWNASTIPDDTIRFRTFDATENPQVLFGVMIVASYGIARLQGSAYDRYREAYPREDRPGLRKAKWLHRLGKVAIAVLILFYFVPTATWAIGLRLFVLGPVYGFLALTLALLLGYGTRAYYQQRLEAAAPPIVGEEPVFVKKVALPAGAPEGMTGVDLGQDQGPVVSASGQVSLRCESCGEPQTVPEGMDPRAVQCANCGRHVRHLDEGKRYLIVAGNPAIVFAWMQDLSQGGKPALCLSPAAPDRLRLEFGVKDLPIVQVSAQKAGAVDPKKLDPSGLKALLPLARAGKGGVIFYDGLDQMVAEASIADVIGFLRKANDLAFVHGVTVLARVSPAFLPDLELKRLNAEFDEYIDLSALL